MQVSTVGFIHTNNYKGISFIVTQEAKKGGLFLLILVPRAATNTEKEKDFKDNPKSNHHLAAVVSQRMIYVCSLLWFAPSSCQSTVSVAVKQRCCSQCDWTGGELKHMEKEPVSPCHSWACCQLLPGGVGAGLMPRKGDE